MDAAPSARVTRSLLILAAGLVAAALAVAALAEIISREPITSAVSPLSSVSAQPSESPVAARTPSVPPSSVASLPQATHHRKLLKSGDIVEMPAIDNEGEWGTIRLERGDEIMTDPASSIYEGGSVLIEIRVTYLPQRKTARSFGGRDWGVRVSDGVPGVVGVAALPATHNPHRPAAESLDTDAFVSESSPADGWIAVEVPTIAESPAVYLTYYGGAGPSPLSAAPTWEVVVRERDRNAPPMIGAPLLRAGDAALLSAVEPAGSLGTITIDRGHDVGGYPLVLDPSSETHFFVELLATYELDHAPQGTEGGHLDWRVESPDGVTQGELLDSFPPPRGRSPLHGWSVAIVPETRYEGWLIFAIPREAADVALELVYQPVGMGEVARIPVRVPGAIPDPVAAEWPRPDPVYVAHDGLPFSVLASAEADGLFVDADTCTSPEGDYTVTYPDSWYTNTEVAGVSACSWFSPVFYDLNDDGSRPEEIAIEIGVFTGAVGFIWADLYTEAITIDGVEARRTETGMTKDPETPTDEFQYSYLARFAPDTTAGRKLSASTGTEYGGGYDLNKAVLDRIMASLEFTD